MMISLQRDQFGHEICICYEILEIGSSKCICNTEENGPLFLFHPVATYFEIMSGSVQFPGLKKKMRKGFDA